LNTLKKLFNINFIIENLILYKGFLNGKNNGYKFFKIYIEDIIKKLEKKITRDIDSHEYLSGSKIDMIEIKKVFIEFYEKSWNKDPLNFIIIDDIFTTLTEYYNIENVAICSLLQKPENKYFESDISYIYGGGMCDADRSGKIIHHSSALKSPGKRIPVVDEKLKEIFEKQEVKLSKHEELQKILKTLESNKPMGETLEAILAPLPTPTSLPPAPTPTPTPTIKSGDFIPKTKLMDLMKESFESFLKSLEMES
jgi:hypothetical protein